MVVLPIRTQNRQIGIDLRNHQLTLLQHIPVQMGRRDAPAHPAVFIRRCARNHRHPRMPCTDPGAVFAQVGRHKMNVSLGNQGPVPREEVHIIFHQIPVLRLEQHGVGGGKQAVQLNLPAAFPQTACQRRIHRITASWQHRHCHSIAAVNLCRSLLRADAQSAYCCRQSPVPARRPRRTGLISVVVMVASRIARYFDCTPERFAPQEQAVPLPKDWRRHRQRSRRTLLNR